MAAIAPEDWVTSATLTANSASPIDAAAVSVSLTAFIVVYFVVFGAGFFYLLRLMRKSPTRYEEGLDSRLPDGTKTDAITHSNHLT